eukprot:m.328472 g.328472  ORF g.328472 m.328472 type:complete len:450 (-) comp19753_c1_seq4:1418-2767(-)
MHKLEIVFPPRLRHVFGPQSKGSNEALTELRRLLVAQDAKGKLDGFACYLYGIVQRELGQRSEAAEQFARAVRMVPEFWGAWRDLGALFIDSSETSQLAQLQLPTNWMWPLFAAWLSLELQHNEEALQQYEHLGDLYPGSSYVRAQTALAHYNLREFDEAEEGFRQLRERDPHSLEHVDTYSNILYVKEMKPELSYLAHEACRIDRFRAETCCAVGNYYSLRNRHQKAVQYFERALKLNRRYLSAWTLMGHEYVELKNAPAAIEAYRRAVEINPRDYRAWYGLGQTYELLYMPLYSVYYYSQAQRLRPYDARMWTALAHTHKGLGRWADAAKCYERAVAYNEGDVASLHELGVLYRDRITPRNPEKAAFYFMKALDLDSDVQIQIDSELALEACVFLAQHFKDLGQYDKARKFANSILAFGGKHKETAKDIVRSVSALQAASSAQGSTV